MAIVRWVTPIPHKDSVAGIVTQGRYQMTKDEIIYYLVLKSSRIGDEQWKAVRVLAKFRKALQEHSEKEFIKLTPRKPSDL